MGDKFIVKKNDKVLKAPKMVIVRVSDQPTITGCEKVSTSVPKVISKSVTINKVFRSKNTQRNHTINSGSHYKL